MSNFIVRRVAILGAGVMGAQIAAHCANAGVPVVLFDLPAKDGDKNRIVQAAIDKLAKQSPAPLANNDDARAIRAANYEDDLALLTTCDLVIEAIAERMDWKHDLYKKVAPHLAAHAIFASNTSGLSIEKLSDGFDADLSARFCGVHFFNPPRYMHLVELIPTDATEPRILDLLETFLTSTLGKGVVRAKDTPNFIANRVGIFGMLSTMIEAEKFALPFDVVDDLTGSKLGRAKSATFRTADVVGLDTMLHVIKTMQDTLPEDPFASAYATPPALKKLVEAGALGQKSQAGFFKKDGKHILQLDPASGEYRPATGKADEAIGKILKGADWAAKLQALRAAEHPQGKFLWAVFRNMFHYIAVHLETIAETARDIDFALRWGFGWTTGPFEIWQAAGWRQIAEWVRSDIDAGLALCAAPLPDWLFSEPVTEHGVHTPQGSWSPASKTYIPRRRLPVYERQVRRAPLLGESSPGTLLPGTTCEETAVVRLWTAPEQDDVLVLSFKTKMHTVGPDVLKGIQTAVALAEKSYRGLVIWSPEEPFSAGADLQAMLPAFLAGGAKAIDPMVADFQNTTLALRYAQVPVVAALSGLALGGGCEVALHCARRVAALETYMGLVEIGVGLIPAGGGLKEIAVRAARAAQTIAATDLLPFLKTGFTAAAMATVGKSAHECRALGYLQPTDPIVFNPHELLYVALGEARQMHNAGYRPPPRVVGIPVAGKTGIATILAQLVNLRDGGFISAYDYTIGKMIATVICGGEVETGSLVDESWLLALERKFFVGLLDNTKTQERIMGMLQTGKPVRN
ncbi:MAG: 3-hydroxyacyl-CoA dehydrogenase/enoyl-CoA hydratase family protein [Burkholderiaceae bacterium]